MSRRRIVVVVVALMLAAVAAFLLWPRGGATPTKAADPAPPREVPGAPPPARATPVAPVQLAGPIGLGAATVVADPGATSGELAGRVLDWGTGAPVADAEVAIAAIDEPSRVAGGGGPTGSAGGAGVLPRGIDAAGTSSFTTDRQGRFLVHPPAPGRYRVISALADGYLPWAPEPGASPIELVARAGQRVEGVVLYLVPEVEYHGRVVDRDGNPVAEASVVLLDAAAGERAAAPITDRYLSDARGEFLFHAPDGALLEASKPGFAPGRARVDGPVAVSHELTIRLGDAGMEQPIEMPITGVTEPGAARVVAIPIQDGPVEDLRTGAETTSAADGSFALPGLRPGMYMVRAFAPDHAPATELVPAGRGDVRLVLGASHRIAGRVVDPGGAAVPAATVAVLVQQGLVREPVAVATVFDAEGRFRIEDLEPGDYLVVAHAYGHAPSAEVPATASADPDPPAITVTVRGGATLVGTMIDADTRQPIEGGKLTVDGVIGDGSSAVPLASAAITAADGSFALAGIAPGRRSITAGAYQHNLLLAGPYELAEGARVGPVTIELTPTAPGETPHMELAGIGAALAAEGEVLRLSRIFPDGGAERAGLLVGDLVLAVDGTPIAELGLDGAIQHIRGPVGTQVVLRVQRGDAAAEDVSVTRTKIRA